MTSHVQVVASALMGAPKFVGLYCGIRGVAPPHILEGDYEPSLPNDDDGESGLL